MTDENLLIEINMLIAEHVYEWSKGEKDHSFYGSGLWRKHSDDPDDYTWCGKKCIPPYSTDIKLAYEALLKVVDYKGFTIRCNPSRMSGGYVQIGYRNAENTSVPLGKPEDLPLVICMTILEYLGVWIHEEIKK